jgi:hypothetical protein
MMVRSLKSPAGRQPDHFEIAMIADANDFFRVGAIPKRVTSASSVSKKLDPGEFASDLNDSFFLPGAG